MYSITPNRPYNTWPLHHFSIGCFLVEVIMSWRDVQPVLPTDFLSFSWPHIPSTLTLTWITSHGAWPYILRLHLFLFRVKTLRGLWLSGRRFGESNRFQRQRPKLPPNRGSKTRSGSQSQANTVFLYCFIRRRRLVFRNHCISIRKTRICSFAFDSPKIRWIIDNLRRLSELVETFFINDMTTM